jgi:predicted metal-dependent enzyme (double-stranded beta helix superfamily)
MDAPGVEVFRRFTASLRTLCGERLGAEAHWSRTAELLGGLLGEPTFRELSRGWPVCGYENLVLHQDAEHGFVVNGLVRGSHHRSPPHDHAHTWTVYGVLDGHETIQTFERTDDGRNEKKASLRLMDTLEAVPGDVHVLRPGLIHTESNGEGRVVAIVVRSDKIGEFLQNAFDPETGAIKKIHGPKQVPFILESPVPS